MATITESARIIVQSDWDCSLRTKGGKAWVTYRGPGDEKKYSELKSEGLTANGYPNVSSEDGFQVDALTDQSINILYENPATGSGYRCQFVPPLFTYRAIHELKKSVLCVAVNGNGLGLSCDTTQTVQLWTTDNGEVRRQLKGHLLDVYTCQFFPSGLVALTGGADMQLKIWSVETGDCAATLAGHSAGITQTEIVDRGRNVVSVSRDGTARLWDCGSQTCLTTLTDIDAGPVNSCAVCVPADSSTDLGEPNTPSEHECGTENKLLLVGCEAGSLQAYSLRSKQKVFSIACSAAVNCCTFVSDTLAVYGTQDGHVAMLDIRNTQEPLREVKENRSAILSLLPYKQGLYVSTGDGSCFYMRETSSTVIELTGPDCDAVYKVVVEGDHVFTACRDGAIRKYRHVS